MYIRSDVAILSNHNQRQHPTVLHLPSNFSPVNMKVGNIFFVHDSWVKHHLSWLNGVANLQILVIFDKMGRTSALHYSGQTSRQKVMCTIFTEMLSMEASATDLVFAFFQFS